MSQKKVSKFAEIQGSVFKFKRSNEEPHKLNAEVKSKITAAKFELNKTDLQNPHVSKTLEKLNQGTNMLDTRQKLIMLADSSELGRKMVDEYQAHALADDSDDEKKIQRASYIEQSGR